MADNLRARAAAAVTYEQGRRRLIGNIATNTNFRPLHETEDGGVDPVEAPEVTPAQEELVRGVLDQLGDMVPVLSIQDWIERESRLRGGKGQLAAALLGIPYKRGAMGKNKKYKATLRALQRSAKATKAGRKEEHHGLGEEYRQLIANFPAGALGNPYSPPRQRGLAALEVSKAQFTILGDWSISSKVYHFAQRGTELKDAKDFDAIWSYPASLIEEVLRMFWADAIEDAIERGSSKEAQDAIASVTPELDWLYRLTLVIELPKEAAQ